MNPNIRRILSHAALGFAALTPTYRASGIRAYRCLPFPSILVTAKIYFGGSMGFLLLVLVIAAVVAVVFWYRKKIASVTEPPPVSNQFHAVTIRFRQNACPAVRALANTRYLAKEAPRLPLDECTVADCRCVYQHYDDRRDDEDRREHSGNVLRYEGEQRRHARLDRRKSNG